MGLLKDFNIETIKTNFQNVKSQMIKSYPEYKMNSEDSGNIYLSQKKRLHDLFNNLEELETGLNSVILMNTDKIKADKTDIEKLKKRTNEYKKNKWNSTMPKNLAGNVLKHDKFNENIEEYLNMSFYCFSIILICGFIYNKQIKN